MAEPHVISALTKKRSELLGDIKHYESIIVSLKDNLSTIDKTIHIFDENYNLSSIKAVNSNKNRYFEPGEATRMLLDILRASATPLLLCDIADEVVARRDLALNSLETRAVTKSLSTTLNSLIRKGLVQKDITGDNSKALWSIAEA